jgi:hypothetical protein
MGELVTEQLGVTLSLSEPFEGMKPLARAGLGGNGEGKVQRDVRGVLFSGMRARGGCYPR